MRELLVDARVPIIAVSPIIGGAAVKGPAAKIMRELDLPVSPLEIARQYGDFLDLMLIDETDAQLLGGRKAGDPAIAAASILMRTRDDRRTLATACLDLLRGLVDPIRTADGGVGPCPALKIDSGRSDYCFHRQHDRPRVSFCHFSSSAWSVDERSFQAMDRRTRTDRLLSRWASWVVSSPSSRATSPLE